MKTKDRIKEEIGFDKLLLTLMIATISSVLSWVWNSNAILSSVIIITVSVFLLFLSIISIITFFKIKFKIVELDKYES